MPRDRTAPELRSVAPLVVVGDGAPRLAAPVTLVANGPRVIGVTSAELLRPLQGKQLAIAATLDGAQRVLVEQWYMGRYTGVAIVELAAPLAATDDVAPLSIGTVNASVDVHGAAAAIVAIASTGRGFERQFVPVHVDPDNGGGMSDHTVYLASPLEPSSVAIEGGAAFAWLPAEPALGRRSEVVAFALAYPYRARIARPRGVPVLAELIGLDDIGRALVSTADENGDRPELGSVAGEIDDD